MGIPPERIFIGGIGQGAAVAVHVLLYGGIKLGGLIGIDAWLPFATAIDDVTRDPSLLLRLHSTLNKEVGEWIDTETLSDHFPQARTHPSDTPLLLLYSNERAFSCTEAMFDFLERHNFEELSREKYCTGENEIFTPESIDHIAAFIDTAMNTPAGQNASSVSASKRSIFDPKEFRKVKMMHQRHLQASHALKYQHMRVLEHSSPTTSTTHSSTPPARTSTGKTTPFCDEKANEMQTANLSAELESIMSLTGRTPATMTLGERLVALEMVKDPSHLDLSDFSDPFSDNLSAQSKNENQAPRDDDLAKFVEK